MLPDTLDLHNILCAQVIIVVQYEIQVGLIPASTLTYRLCTPGGSYYPEYGMHMHAINN